ncbi:MAG: sugar ABC transporter ATP-binding protein [Chitinophagaceae bacterium]|nr:sugar ABC transporter ATP-binding protein [Chitinophagaceae bacterium]MCW5925797.1 sugar ABC transporter ATP-binding protein [Chitinophagaceae bacterium]
MGNYLFSAENISKSFPGVKALDKVSLHVEKGKVHALMGENGAGKSTLMKIVMGMVPYDEGTLIYKGAPVRFLSVHDAIKSGFAMIHQELLPFPELTVAENIFMGREPGGILPGFISKKKLNEDARQLLKSLKLSVKETRLMKELSVAEMQMVEIAKAISNNTDIIIMDEPTSAISGREVTILFEVIRELTAKGIAVIYISHKMDEIFQIADTITVMRDGKHITTLPAKELNDEKLIQLIVGRELSSIFDKKNNMPGETLLEVKNLSGEKFSDISFVVKKGEVLGIAGLMGAGRTEIAETIYGLRRPAGGAVYIRNKRIHKPSPSVSIKNGIGLISEDRKRTGLVLTASVRHNITMASLEKWSGFLLDKRKEQKVSREQVQKFGIKTPSAEQTVNNLSGGNQQKIVLSKVLLNDPEIIIFDEPTRGIDIGAKTEIYKMITALAEQGKAIIMISSELPEVLGLSDRILVIRNGRISKELAAGEATQEIIMQYAMI